MNPSNVYWQPPQYNKQFLEPISGTPGFLFNLPYRGPVSEAMSFGEGRENIRGVRELISTTLPELHAVGNILPSTAGFPRVNPQSFQGSFRRAPYIKKV